MTDVEVRVAIVKLGVERVEKAQVKGIVRLTEGRAEVVFRHRVGVTGRELQAQITQVATLQRSDHGAVVRFTLVAARVQRVVLGVQKPIRVRCSKALSRTKDNAGQTGAVVVGQIVETPTSRAGVFD